MNEFMKLLGAMAYGLSKLCRFNAVAGALASFAYSEMARLLDREFWGMDSGELMWLGACLLVGFFLLEMGLVGLANWMFSENASGGQKA